MIQKIFVILLLCFVILEAKESGKVFKVVPVISSNPTAGTGAGIMSSLTYKADKASSPSQALAALQYTNTDSYSLFLANKLFFNADKWQSNTMYAHIFNNTSFDIDLPIGLPVNSNLNPNYEITIDAFLEQVMYLIQKNIYIGGQIFYMSQDFTAKNNDGTVFLISNGIESVDRGGIGAIISYDTRSKNEKFYPTHSTFINLSFNYFPKSMGSNEMFYNTLLNARKYMRGYSTNDVIAMQFVGQYCSENTPDGALAALGARNIIRGFPIGKYKTRYLNAIQAEYRYRIKESRFRIAPFAGYANLSGGSSGTEFGNRDKNNGDYYSGGVGMHYILDKKHQLDYRIDVAYSSDDETSVYASLNQAF